MPCTIYLQFDEEIISALQKIRRTGDPEIIMVVPTGAKLFRNLTGLKLLKREAEKYEKTFFLATADERGRLLATRAGISLATQPLTSPASASAVAAVVKKPALTRMGDIVMRPLKSTSAGKVKIEAPLKAAAPTNELVDLIGPQSGSSVDIKVPEPVRIPMPPLRYTLLPAAVVVLILALLAVFVLPGAEIIVKPRTEPVTRDLEVQVDSKVGVPDVSNLTIPGKIITDQVSESKTYAATGVKNTGEKASGFVTLYNFSKTTLILRKGTTRLEAKGKVYYFLQDVGNIRPTGRIGADLEVDQSSLVDPVPIVAADSGEDSNLPAGTRFEIYNEVFGHQPQALYALNGNPVAGGTNKQIKTVSAADIEAARKDLKDLLVAKFRESVKQKLTPDSKLSDNAFATSVVEEKITPPVNSEAENFSLSQTANITALAYDESDVRDLIVERIVRLLPENKYLLPAQEQRLSAQFVSLDLAGGIGTLRAHFESEVRYQINADFLSRSLPGKSSTQVKEILLARPEIQDVQVKLSPFWVNTVPRFGNKINFKIQQ